MKIKSEKGITGTDITVGIILFLLASSVIFTLFHNIYMTVIEIKIHEVAVGVITDIFENIDLENYENLTETKLQKIINDSNAKNYFNLIQDKSKVEYKIEKYSDINPNAEDIVKKIKIVVNYKINGISKKISMNKIKIRE